MSEPGSIEPKVSASLSSTEEATLAALLDATIPPSPDGRMPGAGALGLAQPFDASIAPSPETRQMVRAALADLERRSRTAHSQSFAELAGEARTAILADHEASSPGFQATIAFLLYTLYYQQPRVLEGLGLEGRPPFPKGYDLPPFDEALLEPVRKRPKMYRLV